MAMGHVILREFHIDRQADYFRDYARQYTDMPMLVRLVKQGEQLRAGAVPARVRLRRCACDETNNPEWKTLAFDETTGAIVVPQGSVGFRWGEKGKWNLEEKDLGRRDTKLRLSLADVKDERRRGRLSPISAIASTTISSGPIIPACSMRNVPVKKLQLAEGETLVAIGLRSVRRQLRRRSRLRRRAPRQELRRCRALHAGLGGEDQRRAARPDHHGGARIRAQRREDQRPLDGDRRRRR